MLRCTLIALAFFTVNSWISECPEGDVVCEAEHDASSMLQSGVSIQKLRERSAQIPAEEVTDGAADEVVQMGDDGTPELGIREEKLKLGKDGKFKLESRVPRRARSSRSTGDGDVGPAEEEEAGWGSDEDAAGELGPLEEEGSNDGDSAGDLGPAEEEGDDFGGEEGGEGELGPVEEEGTDTKPYIEEPEGDDYIEPFEEEPDDNDYAGTEETEGEKGPVEEELDPESEPAADGSSTAPDESSGDVGPDQETEGEKGPVEEELDPEPEPAADGSSTAPDESSGDVGLVEEEPNPDEEDGELGPVEEEDGDDLPMSWDIDDLEDQDGELDGASDEEVKMGEDGTVEMGPADEDVTFGEDGEVELEPASSTASHDE